MSTLRPGDEVTTPRGPGVVVAVVGPPTARIVTVEVGGFTVDLREREISLPWRPDDVESIDRFLQAPAQPTVAEVEQFLDEPQSVPQPPAAGRSRGARVMTCSCPCGRLGGCQRLSTAPAVHHVNAGSCRCEAQGCACLERP